MAQGEPTGAFNPPSTIDRAPVRPRQRRAGSLNPTLKQRQFTNASHWPMVDQPEQTAEAISAFFDGI